MAMRTLLVGYGWWGKVLEKTVLEMLPKEIELVGVVSAHDLGMPRSGVVVYANYEHALSKSQPEAVILATPHSLHLSQIEAAAEAGCHVFCEKPLALNLKDAQRAVKACKEAGVILGIGFQRRRWPSFLALQDFVRTGRLGEIRLLEGNYSNNTDVASVSGNWRTRSEETPGALGLSGMSIHPLDQMVSLAGELDSAKAMVTAAASVSLKFKSGAVGSLSWLQGTPEYYRLAVFGSQGWAELSSPYEGRWKDVGGNEQPLVGESERVDPLEENLRCFTGAVRNDGEWPVSATDLLNTVAALEEVADITQVRRETPESSQ